MRKLLCEKRKVCKLIALCLKKRQFKTHKSKLLHDQITHKVIFENHSLLIVWVYTCYQKTDWIYHLWAILLTKCYVAFLKLKSQRNIWTITSWEFLKKIYFKKHRHVFHSREWFDHALFHLLWVFTPQKRWSFPLRISSVNVTKSAGNCRFGHIYWRIP